MKKHATYNEGEHLAEDAQALLAATAHVAEEKVVEARRRQLPFLRAVQVR